MGRVRTIACLSATGLALALAGCGNDDPAEGLVSNVDRVRNAASVAAIQTSLVTAALVQADSPGASAQSLVAALQAKDPGNRYTTAVPTGTGIVQVVGGGGGPLMLVSVNSAPSSGRAPYYVAAWQGGGTTMYYVGRRSPAYTPAAPAATGWSATPPQ